MAILSSSEVSTELFTYHPQTNSWVTEASDLPREFRLEEGSNQFTLVSAKTGRRIVFVLVREQRDWEGELQYHEFRPANPADWAAGTVRIFND